MFKHLLTPLAAASLLCAGCSQLNPFSGDEDGSSVASASWNGSSETESAWSPETESSPVAAYTGTENGEDAGAYQFENQTGNESGNPELATAEEASAAAYDYSVPVSTDPVDELFARVDDLQAATASLTEDVQQLSKQFGALATSFNAASARGQATERFVAGASEQFGAFGTALASLDSQISSLAADVGATRNDLRGVTTAVNKAGESTAGLNPAIEQGFSSNGTWFKITLGAVIAGCAAIGFLCWKGFSSQRDNAPAGL